MGINVNYAPDLTAMGEAAFSAGLGEYRQRQQQQANQQALQWAQLQQHGQLAAAQMAQQERAHVFDTAASFAKMGYGSELNRAAAGEQQQFQWEMARQHQAEQLAQQKDQAQLQEKLIQKRFDAEGQAKLAEQDRELAHINSIAWPDEESKGMALAQHNAKWGGYDWRPHVLPKGMRPGDILKGSDGSEFFINPAGDPKKTSSPAPTLAPMFIPGMVDEKGQPVPIIDPNTGTPALYYKNSRGDPTLLETPKKEKAPEPKPLMSAETVLKIREQVQTAMLQETDGTDELGKPKPKAFDQAEYNRRVQEEIAGVAAIIGHPHSRQDMSLPAPPAAAAPPPPPPERAASAGPPQISTEAEWQALPSGTVYLAPDGHLKRKK